MLFAVAVLVWYAVFCESRAGAEIYFLDVGQGDAAFIEASNGNQVLIDGGPDRKVLSELSKVMPFYDHSIDVLIESHPDADHIAGLIEVLKNYKVGAIIEPGTVSDSSVYVELENLIKEKRVKKFILSSGAKIDLGNGAYFDVLLPPAGADTSKMSSHDGILVLKLYYGNNSFLFTGDMENKMENYLVSTDSAGLKSDVLKIGHHGSKTSTSELFLGWVQPQYAVISVGKDNKYGHPTQEILDRLVQFKIPILRTDEKGTIEIKTDGENLKVAN
ncbi:MAG: DNA internalization-related competence protein ComEC/Rec2 [Parcubacteria group bacterium Athens0714_26]|nr:MAG: DNA internalization-related competence protein ComEC/Rec2 [Parcubacteria group bacterium Athens0714_26]